VRREQVVSSDSPYTISEDEYLATTGEEISTTLDLDTWQVGVDIGALYQRIQAEVEPVIAQERRVQQTVAITYSPSCARLRMRRRKPGSIPPKWPT
jgi:hypothetical protein